MCRIEQQLDTKIYPGTEIMADVGSLHFVKASDRVLVPQPSESPHDPLVWPISFDVLRRGLTSAELEQVLEDERHVHVHGGVVQSGVRTIGTRAHVSTIDALFQC
jgi:hypothetical protein